MPLVGTWIEIAWRVSDLLVEVVPLVGTWIEIATSQSRLRQMRRAPRGHVD